MARSPVPEMIERFHQMTPEEQKVFLDLVDPQPEPEPPAKQTRKKRGPSKKAQSLSAAIARTPKTDTNTDATANGGWCTAKIPGLDVVCGDPADNMIHDPNAGYGGYHPFVPPAQVAAKRSSRKGAATNSIQSTADDSENVLSASSGD